MIEKVKFQYSPLGEAFKKNAKTKTDQKDKGDKHLVYNQQHDFHKKFIKLKGVNPQTKANEDLKAKVMDNAGDIFNELCNTYKEKYEEEKDALNENDTKKFGNTKLRLSDHYEHESEEEEKKLVKTLIRKIHLKKPTQNSVKELSKLVNKEETDMNCGIISKAFHIY